MADTFVLREEHIKILHGASWYWEDSMSGGLAVNPKRPFGNSGDSSVAADIAELLGIERKKCPHCDEALDDDGESFQERMLALYRETETALAVILGARSFQPGTYKRRLEGAWERLA